MLTERMRDWLLVGALTVAAILLHGYYYGIEDQTLYLPAIAQALDPTLFPHDAVFFQTEARFTLFDETVAALIRVSRLSTESVVFFGYIASLLATLRACQRLARHAFNDRRAEWAGLLALVILLPFPVAGTRIGLIEWYLHPRAPAMACMLWAAVFAMEGNAVSILMVGAAAVFHPLVALWGVAHVAFQARRIKLQYLVPALLVSFMTGCASSVSRLPRWETAYWRDALTPEYFDIRYPINWPWFEWVGALTPLAVLAVMAWDARRRGAGSLANISGRLFLSGAFGIVLAVALTLSPSRRLPLQPMRELHMVYFVTIVLAGAALEQRFLRTFAFGRTLFFAAITVAVLVGQPRFPSSPRIEWPWRPPGNPWSQAFLWAREHTPVDALFALDPFYMRRTTADTHSFRALAHRSMMAEAVHDLAPAAMSPTLGARWMRESEDLASWRRFTNADFKRLADKYGVGWVVVSQPHLPELTCPYENRDVAVCRVGQP